MEGLAELRRSKGFSQRTLAEAAGVSPSTIYELERGAHTAHPSTAKKLADAMSVEVTDILEALEAPKGTAPPSIEPSFNDVLEEERRLRYLRGWRAFVHRIAGRWEKEPPKTSAELSPLFDAMTALMEQGVFEMSNATEDRSEWHELMLFMEGIKRLNRIADTVEENEQAEQRRATLRRIEGQLSA